jgi:hypothetical protein
MKYRKLDRAMWKSGIEYFVDEGSAAVYIETEPEKNEVALKNIESAMGRNETCVSRSPGRFAVIQIAVKTWKV